MKFSELPAGTRYRIVGAPEHRLYKCDDTVSVTEGLEMFLCRPDVEVEAEQATEAKGGTT